MKNKRKALEDWRNFQKPKLNVKKQNIRKRWLDDVWPSFQPKVIWREAILDMHYYKTFICR